MADQDFPASEEHSDSSPDDSQWQIPFDAAAGVGRAESAAPEESGTAEVNAPAASDGLRSPDVPSAPPFNARLPLLRALLLPQLWLLRREIEWRHLTPSPWDSTGRRLSGPTQALR
jgi:hypothetical protein